MKKAGIKIGPYEKVIAFFFVATIFYGVFIAPFTNNTPKNQPEIIESYTAAPTLPPTPAPTMAPTSIPTETPAPTPAPTNTPAPTEPPTLRQGDKGQDVKQLQEQLIKLGYLSGAADGDFGKKTAQAVRDFQVCNHLKEDGIFGSACWDTLSRGYNIVEQRTVYVSKAEIYHTDEHCSGMKTSTAMKLSDAIRKGYKGHHCH